jgi:amino acid transporter
VTDESVLLCAHGSTCCVKKELPPATDAAKKPSGPGTSVTLPDPLGGITIPEMVGRIIRSFTGVAGAIALLMFVWGGVKWIISGGKEGEVKEAQQILRNATIGLILIFGAYFFTSAVIQGLLTNPAG